MNDVFNDRSTGIVLGGGKRFFRVGMLNIVKMNFLTDGTCRYDVDYLVSVGAEEGSWIGHVPSNPSFDELVTEICEQSAGYGADQLLEDVEVEEETGDGNWKGSDKDDDGTPERLAEWMGQVVTVRKERESKMYIGRRFEVRCFAVEWRSSVVVDVDAFMMGLFRLFGGESSFVLGANVGKLRADYLLVIRPFERIRWSDWRTKLMFGYGTEAGDEGEGEHLGRFLRVSVPSRASAEGTTAFVKEMLEGCGTYPITKRYRAEEMCLEVDRTYSRPARKRKADEKGH